MVAREMARRTGFREQYYTDTRGISVSGKIAGNIKVKLYVFCDGYLMISLDQCIRLGWRLVWYKILSVCFHGLQRDHPENPYEQDYAASRSVHLIEI